MDKVAGNIPDCVHFFIACAYEFLKGISLGAELLDCGTRIVSSSGKSIRSQKKRRAILLAGLGQACFSVTARGVEKLYLS